MVQWLGLCAFTALAWVRSLVRELRSRKPSGMTNRKKKEREKDPSGCFVENGVGNQEAAPWTT